MSTGKLFIASFLLTIFAVASIGTANAGGHSSYSFGISTGGFGYPGYYAPAPVYPVYPAYPAYYPAYPAYPAYYAPAYPAPYYGPGAGFSFSYHGH